MFIFNVTDMKNYFHILGLSSVTYISFSFKKSVEQLSFPRWSVLGCIVNLFSVVVQ